VLTLTALEVQPWPESLHCVDILCHPLFGLFSLGVGQTECIGGGALHTKNIVQVPPQVYLRSKE